ncbi:uncharacterized protein LOC120374538 isoform X2 [Mauremys reevesii]|uniref:uncharacterized protein LOC120374538 isoform X2 n=1 Tax=Mauremys reevesii TaxID=260615 RepID=UPI00193EEDF4|nr:uncharacterized protein LOC120374538 isoform X2 [Mauremys reevesii]
MMDIIGPPSENDSEEVYPDYISMYHEPSDMSAGPVVLLLEPDQPESAISTPPLNPEALPFFPVGEVLREGVDVCNDPPGSSSVGNEVATDVAPSTIGNSVVDAKSDGALLTRPVKDKEGMVQPLRRSQRQVRPPQWLTYDVVGVSSEVSIRMVHRKVVVLKDFKTSVESKPKYVSSKDEFKCFSWREKESSRGPSSIPTTEGFTPGGVFSGQPSGGTTNFNFL